MIKHNMRCLGKYHVPDSTKGGICVDIGANCGSFGLKYANHFREIHYYEPVDSSFEICNDRLKVFGHIKGFQEAVHEKDNLLIDIVIHRSNDAGSCAVDSDIIVEKEWTTQIIKQGAPTVSLETILSRIAKLSDHDAEYLVDYMKIDCETSEYLFLINKDLSKIKYLGIEIHWQMGINNWNRLVDHLLMYFKNVKEDDLKYPLHANKEFFFTNKKLFSS